MAGFDLAQADILRKAMGKKDLKQLESLKEAFLAGVLQQGHSQELAQNLYDLIEKFANYGFNKSHSVAYGLVSYQMAYLKANYPQFFYTSLLTSVIGSDVKTRQYIEECRQRGIKVVGPTIQSSDAFYIANEGSILVPLTSIKGISATMSATIVQERQKTGPYRSYFDAISRLSLIGVRKNQCVALIKAGALDFVGMNRTTLMHGLDDALRYTNIIKVETAEGVRLNHDLVSEPRLTMMKDFTLDVLNDEYEVLGMYFSHHPTKGFHSEQDSMIEALRDGNQGVRIVGLIEQIKNHKTKQGDPMAFVTLSDHTGGVDGVLFPRVYERYQTLLVKGDMIRVWGKVQNGGSFIVDRVEAVS